MAALGKEDGGLPLAVERLLDESERSGFGRGEDGASSLVGVVLRG